MYNFSDVAVHFKRRYCSLSAAKGVQLERYIQWTELFENDTMVSALVDRLTFHSHILDMNGVSYRLEQSKNN